jgi:hypothetical protein
MFSTISRLVTDRLIAPTPLALCNLAEGSLRKYDLYLYNRRLERACY